MPRGVDDIAELLLQIDSTDIVLKHDKTTTVTVVALATQPDQPIVLKRYNAKGIWHRISRSVRESRAQRCWRMSFAFAKAGIVVAPPFMMHETQFCGLNGNAFFASQKLGGQELLAALPKLERVEQDRVVATVQQLFKALAEHKLSHGDMKATNLLWDGQTLTLIDLDAAQQHTSETTWQRAHLKDKRRFLKNWQDQPELSGRFEFLGG